jgi:hypothetical protein
MKPSKIETAKGKVTNKAKTVGATALIAAIPASAIASTFLYPKPSNGKPKVADTAKSPATANTNDFELPLPGPTHADRSPGTPSPAESSAPVPTGYEMNPNVPNEPIVEGKSNGVPEAPVSLVYEESNKVLVPAQPPKLAFTGPMEITANPFSNDQSTPGHPAVVAGQGGEVTGNPAPPPAETH